MEYSSSTAAVSFRALQITESGLTPGKVLLIPQFNGTLKSWDISRALEPLISEGGKAWIEAENDHSAVAAASPSRSTVQMEGIEVPARLVVECPMEWRSFKRFKGRLSHNQRKVSREVSQLKERIPQDAAEPDLPLQDITNSPEIVRTRRSVGKKKIQWRNKNAVKSNIDARYDAALKEAVSLFHAKKDGTETKSQTKYLFDGIGKENSREKKMLSLITVKRYVKNGISVPFKKGKSPVISRAWVELIAVHINMSQVSTLDEADTNTIHATMMASALGTEFEDAFNLDYAWKTVRREHADTLIPVDRRSAKDIRWNWVTYGNIEQFFKDLKEMVLEYSSAIDEEALPDSSFPEITLILDMLARWLQYDESHHPLDNGHDVSAPRSKTVTHAHPKLSRGGARSARCWHHVSGCYGVTMAGKPIPPLYIYSSKAKEGSEQVQLKWTETHAYIRRKWGHMTYQSFTPWVAAQREGSMDNKLFMEYITKVNLELFPGETSSSCLWKAETTKTALHSTSRTRRR